MIKLTRVRTTATIPSAFTGKARINLNKKLISAEVDILIDNSKKHIWDSKIWGKSKPQLLKETYGKCAYCEAPLTHIAYGDVEHYRPKSIYWWLAYCYENYLASCTLCNQAFKKDKFPVTGKIWKLTGISTTITKKKVELIAPKINPDPLNEPDGMPYSEFEKNHIAESALLINPYYNNDPEKIFIYRADEVLKEIEITVKKSAKNATKIQKAIVDGYGLNRLGVGQIASSSFFD